MPETISAVPQNDYTFLPSPQGAEGPQFVQAKTDAIDHLVRRTSTQKQLNRSLAMSDPHWRPSSNDAKATMHRKTETSASWSSAPLQEALSAYCENKNKADRLRQDLSKTKLRDFLSQEKSGLCFTRTSLTEQEFETFIKALKKAGHGSSSSLPNLLKTAWSKVQQAAHQPASLQQSTAQSARALSDKATAPSHKGLNPIEDDGVSHISNTSPQATTSTDLLPTFFLQLLNAYLRTTNGRSFNNINVAHVKNIEEDITANKTIGTYLKLESGEVRWKDNNANITDRVLTSLLTEFEARHKKKGSLMKLLAKFSIPESGSKEYNAADKAAESQNRNEALQTPRNSALLPQNNVHSAKISIPTSSNNPFDEDKNSTEDTSDTATTERLRTYSALNESAESYPDKYNPFAETSASSDTDPPEELRTDNGPNKIAELNPNKNKNVADAKANSVEQAQPSNVSATLPQATSSANTLSAQNKNEHYTDDKNPFAEDDDVPHTSSTSPQAEPSADLLPNIVLQSLNKYLTTLNGRSFGDVNKAHVKKIKEDIANNEIISQYLRLSNNKLEWRDKEVVFTKDVLNSLLNAFKAEHKEGESMYKVLSPVLRMLNAADAEADSVEQTQTSSSSVTPPQATSSEEENLEDLLKIVLESLNTYLQKDKKRSVVGIGLTHVEKIQKDFDNNLIIRKLLTWENGLLKWTGNNLTKENLQSLLNAFKTGHVRGTSSLFKFLSDPRLRAAGLEILSETEYQKVIQQAAKPALQSFDNVEALLEFLRKPENHDKRLPDNTLGPLIEHLGRIKPDLQKPEKILGKKEIISSLDKIRNFGAATSKVLNNQLPTQEQKETLLKAVEALGNDLRKEMLSLLTNKDHPPMTVRDSIVETLTNILKAANLEASKKGGYNIFPDSLNAEITKQIYEQVKQKDQAAKENMIAYFEKLYVDALTAAALNFSASDYFKDKARARTADNIIIINTTLASLYEIAQNFREKNVHETSAYVSQDNQRLLSQKFGELLPSLADSSEAKRLSNYQYICVPYKQALDNIKIPRSDKFKQSLTSSTARCVLAKELYNDVIKFIPVNNVKAGLKLQSKDVVQAKEAAQALNKVIDPLLNEFRKSLPKVESRWQTFKIALIKTFKPTPGRILGCIPLVGGLTIALTTLPKVIAIPLGITAGVVLPFALLGWIGWNIYKHFDQRSQIQHENTKALKPVNDIRSLITTAAMAKDQPTA